MSCCCEPKQNAASQKKPNEDVDVATLLKEWDFDKFFPKFPESPKKPTPQKQESNNNNNNNSKDKKKPSHRRMDSDSKISNPFLRGFRRENSDFFPLSSRHSAIYIDRNAQGARSSGIFNNQR